MILNRKIKKLNNQAKALSFLIESSSSNLPGAGIPVKMIKFERNGSIVERWIDKYGHPADNPKDKDQSTDNNEAANKSDRDQSLARSPKGKKGQKKDAQNNVQVDQINKTPNQLVEKTPKIINQINNFTYKEVGLLMDSLPPVLKGKVMNVISGFNENLGKELVIGVETGFTNSTEDLSKFIQENGFSKSMDFALENIDKAQKNPKNQAGVIIGMVSTFSGCSATLGIDGVPGKDNQVSFFKPLSSKVIKSIQNEGQNIYNAIATSLTAFNLNEMNNFVKKAGMVKEEVSEHIQAALVTIHKKAIDLFEELKKDFRDIDSFQGNLLLPALGVDTDDPDMDLHKFISQKRRQLTSSANSKLMAGMQLRRNVDVTTEMSLINVLDQIDGQIREWEKKNPNVARVPLSDRGAIAKNKRKAEMDKSTALIISKTNLMNFRKTLLDTEKQINQESKDKLTGEKLDKEKSANLIKQFNQLMAVLGLNFNFESMNNGVIKSAMQDYLKMLNLGVDAKEARRKLLIAVSEASIAKVHDDYQNEINQDITTIRRKLRTNG